jgi:ATP-dependent helicase HrpA
VVAPELQPALREGLVRALLAGETPHPSQGRVRRAVAEAAELWRRSGGTLTALSPEALRERLLAQLEGVGSWDEFLRTPLELNWEAEVPAAERERLLALPTKVRLLGDTVPIHYEVTPEGGVARLHLREGQVRRLHADDLPELDRPLRFAVVRGTRPAAEADTLEEARTALAELEREERRARFKPPRHRHHGRRRG